ncbi:MAG: hypothetical protein IKZ32_00410 [Alistipes sp.]|nr:hypothetical protein [Alistipes sp.]
MSATSTKNVSIRLMSGGHAFSTKELEELLQSGACREVEVVTAKTILRPEQGFDSTMAQRDFEELGFAIDEDEVVVCSPSKYGRVALMAIGKECYERLISIGSEVVFTSPLIDGDDLEQGSSLTLVGDVLYVRVYNEGLRFAEAIAVQSDADLLYYLESIHRVYNIYNMYARALGNKERVVKVCGKLFKQLE